MNLKIGDKSDRKSKGHALNRTQMRAIWGGRGEVLGAPPHAHFHLESLRISWGRPTLPMPCAL
jgi:hypothetical protein